MSKEVRENEETKYNKGYVNALRDFGKFCDGYCMECPMQEVKGSELTCQEFMAEYPEKFASLMEIASSSEQSYLSEFRKRFPENEMTLEDLSTNLCRKLVFGGDSSCSGGDCRACWQEEYEEDAPDDDEDIEDEFETSDE